jgi:hypothetical protein
VLLCATLGLGAVIVLIVQASELRELRFLLSRMLDVPNLPTMLRRDIELVLKKR